MRSTPLLLLLAACANPRSGQVIRIEASHYQSMAGVKIGSDSGPLTCNRESTTGSHILQWYCRVEELGPQYQLGMPVQLVLRGR